MGWIQRLWAWFRSLFGGGKEMELCIVGLAGAGKTSLVNVLYSGSFKEDVIPTVGFTMRRVRKGKVSMKIWDLGGQKRFRSMWERYCRGVNAIVFVVDSAERKSFNDAAAAMADLLEKQPLHDVPLLVLGNKSDLPDTVPIQELVSTLKVREITEGRKVGYYACSCKTKANITSVTDWLLKLVD